MWNWFSVGRISPNGTLRLRDHIRRTIEHLSVAERILTKSLDELAKQPKRRGGFFAIKDHGDGLPPHDMQAPTLMALGIYEGKPVGRRKSLIAA
jgi:hypothetical protein